MTQLIILHGWKSSSKKWQEVKQTLESQNRGLDVLTLDLPGFKPENKLLKPWSLDDYVEWVYQVKEAQHIKEPFYLLGHSFGGRIALKFALKYPELLKGLILVSSAGIKNTSFKTKMLNLMARISQKIKIQKCPCFDFSRKFVYRFILKKTDYLKTDDDLAMKETMKMALKEDLLPLLSEIKTKTLLLWGAKDKLTPLENGKLMKEKISNSELIVLEGVGHAPYLECPELLSEKILTFLECKK